MGQRRPSDLMADIFGPRQEADAYRVTLYMHDNPGECVVHVVLRVGDDASVSFAKDWLHESQPQPLVSGVYFDAWRVEKFIRPGVYEDIGQGLAERRCRWSRGSWKSLRKRIEERAGASDYRNGLWSIDAEITPRSGARRNRLAKRRPGRKQRSSRALTPFQQKMQQMREEARQKVGEKPRAPISETQQQWREMVDRARSGNLRAGNSRTSNRLLD